MTWGNSSWGEVAWVDEPATASGGGTNVTLTAAAGSGAVEPFGIEIDEGFGGTAGSGAAAGFGATLNLALAAAAGTGAAAAFSIEEDNTLSAVAGSGTALSFSISGGALNVSLGAAAATGTAAAFGPEIDTASTGVAGTGAASGFSIEEDVALSSVAGTCVAVDFGLSGATELISGGATLPRRLPRKRKRQRFVFPNGLVVWAYDEATARAMFARAAGTAQKSAPEPAEGPQPEIAPEEGESTRGAPALASAPETALLAPAHPVPSPDFSQIELRRRRDALLAEMVRQERDAAELAEIEKRTAMMRAEEEFVILQLLLMDDAA